jgi:DNA-binding beta-propeller fold protein YncE
MRSKPGRADLRGMCLPAAFAAVALSCGRAEKPPARASTAASPAASAATPTDARSEARIREAPEGNLPPFSGLRAARGAAVDGRKRLWVTDFEHAAIRIYDPSGGYLGGWGSRGDGTYQLKDPCGIAIRGEDVYIADTWNGRIVHFSLAGGFLGKAPGDFYGPRGVAAAPDGRVWISDTGNNRIVACQKDLSDPKRFGTKGEGPEQLSSPIGIAAGPSGRIYVADSGNRRIQVLDADGNFKARLAFQGWGPNTEPYLQVDDEENIYASDPSNQAVVELDQSGKQLRRWTEDDAGHKFAKPTGLALDHKSQILYVVNTDNDTIATLKLSR